MIRVSSCNERIVPSAGQRTLVALISLKLEEDQI
jgi:hypothetical protein